MVLDSAQRSQVETLVASIDGLSVDDSPGIAIAATFKPNLVHIVGTPVGLLRLSAHLLALAMGSSWRERERLLASQCAEGSWHVLATVSDDVSGMLRVLDAAPLPPSNRRAMLFSGSMGTLAVTSLLFWAIGLYATITWVGTRVAAWW